METWPSQLQDKMNVQNFQIVFGKTTIRSEMDVGPDKIRSRFTDGIDLYNTSIDLDIDDYSVLSTFYKTTLGNGTRSFGFLNPMTNTTDEFRFVTEPTIQPLGGRYFRVTLSWEKLP